MSQPLDNFIRLLRRTLSDGQASQETTEMLRQFAMHLIDHDNETSSEELRSALRAALADPPQARSFAADSGLRGRSRVY